ncbi:MAG: hypothetical protein KAT68_14800 [Bacteroidales bacterium]|nr:hypothetical protein [Bacteroidales bacterium]
MKKELIYLGLGLLFSLNLLSGSGHFLSWKLHLAFGLLLMVYGSYLMINNHEKKKALKYVVPAWSIFLLVCLVSFSSNNKVNVIYESDLKEATNFEEIETCEEGRIKAEKDIKNGKLRYIFGSYGSRQPLARNLKKDYDIEIIEVDGVIGMPNECYNQVMYKEIQKRYGQDVFTKAFE